MCMDERTLAKGGRRPPENDEFLVDASSVSLFMAENARISAFTAADLWEAFEVCNGLVAAVEDCNEGPL